MPNWCSNHLMVSGNPKVIKQFLKANLGLPAEYPHPTFSTDEEKANETEPRFCFNALVPTPKEVLDIGYDARNVIPRINQKYALRGHAVMPLDGYHWNIANWGTKWDIYYANITPDSIGWQDGDHELNLVFLTAWSPPIAWLETVVALYPSLHFLMHCEEPGCFFAGDVFGEAGACSVDDYNAIRCEKIFSGDIEKDEVLIV